LEFGKQIVVPNPATEPAIVKLNDCGAATFPHKSVTEPEEFNKEIVYVPEDVKLGETERVKVLSWVAPAEHPAELTPVTV
jgi:hypothetical protein